MQLEKCKKKDTCFYAHSVDELRAYPGQTEILKDQLKRVYPHLRNKKGKRSKENVSGAKPSPQPEKGVLAEEQA